jgi:hypothetical protein
MCVIYGIVLLMLAPFLIILALLMSLGSAEAQPMVGNCVPNTGDPWPPNGCRTPQDLNPAIARAINPSFSSIDNKPTTLAGYRITDALGNNSNLSDLQNETSARTILGAAATANNLSDMASAPTALNNILGLPHKANNAALTATASTDFAAVVRDGYAVAGDAPLVMYKASNLACPAGAGAGDGITQIRSSDNYCWLLVPPSNPTPQLCGTVGDGTTDDAPAFRKCLAAFPHLDVPGIRSFLTVLAAVASGGANTIALASAQNIAVGSIIKIPGAGPGGGQIHRERDEYRR